MSIVFPFHLHRRGADGPIDDVHVVRDMIEQVLLTAPGERVNRPDFGCGLLQMTFGGLSDVLETALQTSVAGALQRWMGDIIQVQGVDVSAQDSQLTIVVSYVDLWTRQNQQVTIVR